MISGVRIETTTFRRTHVLILFRHFDKIYGDMYVSAARRSSCVETSDQYLNYAINDVVLSFQTKYNS